MKDVASYVNAEKRKFENREKAKQVFQELGFEKEADDARELVLEGLLHHSNVLSSLAEELFKQPAPKTAGERRALERRQRFMVFTDCIIFARYKKDDLESVKKATL